MKGSHHGGGDGLTGHGEDERQPVHPADNVSGVAAQGLVGVDAEGTGRGVGDGHLGQCTEYDKDQYSAKRKGQHDSGACLAYGNGTTQEE